MSTDSHGIEGNKSKVTNYKLVIMQFKAEMHANKWIVLKIASYHKKNMASIEVRNNSYVSLRDQAVDYRYDP